MAQDSIVRRLQQSISRLAQTPDHIDRPDTGDEHKTRESVRRLSRSRVSLLLRQLRAAHGFTYAQIQVDTGLSQQLLFDMEFKDRRLTLDELRLLADYYQVSVNDILGIDVE